jgi:glycosyltransferase involved in cell wall biosynthesis
MRFHILAIPHTISVAEYSSCAFTQKVVKLCRMLKMEGHTVIHYGHQASDVDCDENVAVTSDADLEASYPGHDWVKDGWPKFNVKDDVYKVFYGNAIQEIAKRKEPNDFLLCPFGLGHRPVGEAHHDMIVVEPGIGYPGGSFAPFRVFESYAVMHAYHGRGAVGTASNSFWYDVVIPNAYDPQDFEYFEEKDDYLLFLGRINAGKGAHIAPQIAKAVGMKLVAAGQGDTSIFGENPVEYVGVVGPEQRRRLLAAAKAVLCPSTFLEPFCGVQVEAYLSGTPVISSDWGAFAEYNIHGTTGWRARTFEQFVWGVEHVEQLVHKQIHAHGLQFSLERVAKLYTDYFKSVLDVRTGKGWYEPRPDRLELVKAI